MGIYTFSNVLNAAIPFFLLFFLTHYLSKEDIGILSNFGVMANLMVPFVGINLMASVQVQYIKEEVDDRNYLSTGLRLAILLTLAFSGVLFFAGSYIETLTQVPRIFLYFIAVYALFNVIIEILLALWRMEDAAINYGVFRIGRTIVEVGLVIILVIGYGMKFEGSIFAMFIAYTIGCLAALLILMKKKLLFGKFDKAYLMHAVRYGVPLIPHTMSGVLIMYSDKLIITHYNGVGDNGVYSIGFMVGQMIGLLQNSFNQAWVPWAYQKLKGGEEKDKKRMVKITYLYIIGILLVVVALWLIAPIIYSFLGKEFGAGMDLVLWVALGFAFNGMYKMVSVYIFYMERTMIIAIMSFGVAIVNIILNFALIPDFGMQGAAVATMSAMGLQFIFTWMISARLIKMPWFGSK